MSESEASRANAAASDQPVRELEHNGVRFTLLGTAHVSRASVDAVQEMAVSGRYDAIAVELCPARLEALTKQDKWRDLDLYRIIRERKAGLVIANLALSGYQRRIAEQFGIEPGAELKAAALAADENDVPLSVIDRDLATTLKRCYRSVPWWKRMYLTTGLLLSSVSSDDVDEEAIERLKEGDILESTFTEFAEQSPELYTALIDERDRYMAARLLEEYADSEYRDVLVVVGAGHLEGLERYLSQGMSDPASEIEKLAAIPGPSLWPKLIPWGILLLVLSGFAIGFSRSPELGWRLVTIWVVINGGLAALGAVAARAHPVTVLTALLAAPLTSLNPAVAAGMVSGLVESWLRKPRISDLERLHADAMTVRGWYANPATRILLVFLLCNLGSAIGTWVAGFQIFDALS